jgi:hypothetical protein
MRKARPIGSDSGQRAQVVAASSASTDHLRSGCAYPLLWTWADDEFNFELDALAVVPEAADCPGSAIHASASGSLVCRVCAAGLSTVPPPARKRPGASGAVGNLAPVVIQT